MKANQRHLPRCQARLIELNRRKHLLASAACFRRREGKEIDAKFAEWCAAEYESEIRRRLEAVPL